MGARWKLEVPGSTRSFTPGSSNTRIRRIRTTPWTVFTVDDGSIAYDLERRHRGVGARVTLLRPRVVHQGRPAAIDGYRKRVLYVSTECSASA